MVKWENTRKILNNEGNNTTNGVPLCSYMNKCSYHLFSKLEIRTPDDITFYLARKQVKQGCCQCKIIKKKTTNTNRGKRL